MKVRETLNFNSDEEAAMVEEIFNNAMGCLGGADRELEAGQAPPACLLGAVARVTRARSSMEQAGSRELPAHAEAKSTRVSLSLQGLPGACACEPGLVKAHSEGLSGGAVERSLHSTGRSLGLQVCACGAPTYLAPCQLTPAPQGPAARACWRRGKSCAPGWRPPRWS